MLKLLRGLVALLTLLPVQTQAVDINGVVMPQEEMEFLFMIADQLSRYTLPADERPIVVVLDNESMDAAFCSGISCKVLGAYDPRLWPDYVFVREGLSQDSGEAVVVHETVHWLQWRQAEPSLLGWSCPQRAAREGEAYVAGHLFAVLYQNTTEGLLIPPAYMCLKQPRNDAPAGVVAPPTITKGAL